MLDRANAAEASTWRTVTVILICSWRSVTCSRTMSALALAGASFQWQPGWQLYAATSWPGSVPTHCPAWAGAARPSTDNEMPARAEAALVMARAFMHSPDSRRAATEVPARDHATVPKTTAPGAGSVTGPRAYLRPERRRGNRSRPR